jgi:hypothetical protein
LYDLADSRLRGRGSPHRAPVFFDDRVFALLGYELVEGRLVRGHMQEIGRLDFTP